MAWTSKWAVLCRCAVRGGFAVPAVRAVCLFHGSWMPCAPVLLQHPYIPACTPACTLPVIKERRQT